jgi:hypothetical protein
MAQINKPSEYFNTVTYSGNGSTQSITGVNFTPDWVWIKKRNDTAFHQLFDVVRGATNGIFSNSANAEAVDAGNLQSFDSDGFTSGSFNGTNASGGTYVAWNWLANGSGVSNTDGSITSTVSASTTSGFSIASFTSPASGNFTFGHGLGVAPNVVILKTTGSTSDWSVFHSSVCDTVRKYLSINTTNALTTNGSDLWSSSLPTNLVMGATAGQACIGSQTCIAYCFAEKKGYSKFGSYVGNASASDNAFVYCGFKPAYVMTKCTSTAGDRWTVYDNKRDPINPTYRRLFPDGNIAESANTDADIDLLSNGFKIRTDAGTSGAAQTYIYMAFAENPLVGTNNIPATAR